MKSIKKLHKHDLPFRVLKDGTGELEWPVSSAHNSKTEIINKIIIIIYYNIEETLH